jgi:hypothetical protein
VPPRRRDNWLYGDGYQSLGLLQTPADDPTAPPELTFYAGEDHWKGPKRLRRYTIRIDGFVSLHARQQRGEFVTSPLIFQGNELTLNFATSAAGSILVELQVASCKTSPANPSPASRLPTATNSSATRSIERSHGARSPM